jgi:hypothetical protein
MWPQRDSRDMRIGFLMNCLEDTGHFDVVGVD